MSLRLDGKLIRSLARLARRRGVSRSEVVRDAVTSFLARESATEPEGDREVWARVIGCVRGGRPDLSERTGEKFKELLRARARRGGGR